MSHQLMEKKTKWIKRRRWGKEKEVKGKGKEKEKGRMR